MLILAGQGNPGAKYAKNRHNTGFLLLDRIHAVHGFGPWRAKFDSEISEGAIDTANGRLKVLLLKPLTYYNESGRALSKACAFYKVGPEAVTLMYDEIDLAPGRVRVKRGGGAAGNNGVRSATAHLGPDFRRIRVGVGHPGDKSLVMPYVLSDFPKVDLEWFVPLGDAICKALPYLLADDDERFQTEVMRLAPAPKLDPKQAGRPGTE